MMAIQESDAGSTVRAVSGKCPFWPTHATISLTLKFQAPASKFFYGDLAKRVVASQQKRVHFLVWDKKAHHKRGPPYLLV